MRFVVQQILGVIHARRTARQTVHHRLDSGHTVLNGAFSEGHASGIPPHPFSIDHHQSTQLPEHGVVRPQPEKGLVHAQRHVREHDGSVTDEAHRSAPQASDFHRAFKHSSSILSRSRDSFLPSLLYVADPYMSDSVRPST